MTMFTSKLASITFASPALILVVVPLALLLLFQLYVRNMDGAVRIAGLEYLDKRKCIVGKWQRAARVIIRSILVLGLGILWAGPEYYSTEPLFERSSQILSKKYIVAFDMSPSMNLPADFKGYGGQELKAGDGGLTRYEMARDALFDFLDRFRGERFGLILFSTEPFFARWPTVETETRFSEVLESIRRGSGTQLQAFSSLTNTDKALALARDAFGDEDGAIILISDAEDDLENLGAAVREIRNADIRLYTIGVGISDEIIAALSDQFSRDSGFRIFRVDSKEEMEEAYTLVGDVEASPQFADDKKSYYSDLRWLSTLALIALTVIVVWVSETRLHRSSISGLYSVGHQKKKYGI